MRWPTAVFLTLALAACKGNTDLVVDVPADVTYQAALELEGSAVRSAKGIQRWSVGTGLQFFIDGAQENVVIGYTDAQLAFAEGIEARFGEPLLASSAPCAPSLPTPTWAVDFEGVDVEVVPTLTAPWIDETCAPLDVTKIIVENLCNGQRCEPIVVSESAYGAVYSLEGCNGTNVTVGREQDNSLCLAFDDPDIDTCPLVLHERHVLPAPFTLERNKLVPGQDIQRVQRPKPQDRRDGTVLDFVFVDDAIVVVGTNDPTRGCGDPGAARRLFILDTATLAVRSEQPAPACMERLVVTPRGIVAPIDDGSIWALGVFDDVGTMTATVALEGVALEIHDHRIVELVTVDDELVVVFGANRDNRPDLQGLTLVSVDSTTLAPRSRVTVAEPREPWSAAVRADRIVAAGVGQQSFVSIVRQDGTLTETSIEHVYPGGEVNDLFVDGSRVYVSLRQALHIFDGATTVRRPVLSQADIIAVHPWPTPNRLLVVELQEQTGPPRQTVVSFFDTTTDRFTTTRWPLGASIAG